MRVCWNQIEELGFQTKQQKPNKQENVQSKRHARVVIRLLMLASKIEISPF